MSEVKCPFCGKDNAAADTLNYANGAPAKYRVVCGACGASTGWKETGGAARWAWEAREAGERGGAGSVNLVINNDSFVLNNLLYTRDRPAGRCTAQKEPRGKLLRISEKAFLGALGECVKVTGGRA